MATGGSFFEPFLASSSSFSLPCVGVYLGMDRFRRVFVRQVVLAWASMAVFGVDVYWWSLGWCPDARGKSIDPF